MDEVRVLIADDHPLIREGLSRLLSEEAGVSVAAFAENGESLMSALPSARPGLIILDLHLGDVHGTDLCARLLRSNPALRIVGYSMVNDPGAIALFIRAGAVGYVTKQSDIAHILHAVRSVCIGGIYLDPAIAGPVMKILQSGPTDSPRTKLSMREKEVLRLILEEKTTSEIAGILCISSDTVETHRRNLLQKTGARNLAGLVRMAIEEGYLRDE
jgi:DNA-binding NarL/FixJ family response regulator